MENKSARPLPLCGFCLGSAEKNRKGEKEELISCADCGNSGHPSCLHFSQTLTERVKRTRWQCLDCKSCTFCGAKGGENMMLFCDSCDRGYHIGCCQPPLHSVPPGSWMCCMCRKQTDTDMQKNSHNRKQKSLDGGDSALAKLDVKGAEGISCLLVDSGGAPVALDAALVNACKPLGLIDDLTRFFLPQNKRRSRVSLSATIDASECQKPQIVSDNLVHGIASRSRHERKKRNLLRSHKNRHLQVLFDRSSRAPSVQGKQQERTSGAQFASARNTQDIAYRKKPRAGGIRVNRKLQNYLFDGLSKYFTPHGERRVCNEQSVSVEQTSDVISADKCHRRKRAQLDSLTDGLSSFFSVSKGRRRQLSSRYEPKRTASQNKAFAIKKKYSFQKKQKVGSSSVQGLFDGLSHLYTAHGQRQRKSVSFYNLSQQRARRSSGSKNLINEQFVSTSSDLKCNSDDSSHSEQVHRDSILQNKSLKSGRHLNKRRYRRYSSNTEFCVFPKAVTDDDLHIFAEAQRSAEQKVDETVFAKCQPQPCCIDFGKFEITSWYSSPYRPDFARLSKLFICPLCLKYLKTRSCLCGHMSKCQMFCPPGDEIYHDGFLSIYEVDGDVNREYCQNLCLLAKLFLDHKTLYYDVEPFLFYVLTHHDSCGTHLIGYFSKEKYCQQKYNLSCIMILPPYQRQGYGRFLIDFSYLLSRIEGQPGSPEKPLSDLGRVSYKAYWKQILTEYLCENRHCSAVSVNDISKATGMTVDDIISSLCSLEMLSDCNFRNQITIKKTHIDEYLRKQEQKQESWIRVKSDCLSWTPFISSYHGQRRYRSSS